MSDVTGRQIAPGDEVRVHFHPPGSMRSFCEGVVSRVDVTTTGGRFFAVDVKHEVILNGEHRIRPGFHDYVRYNDPNDFEGRIEILATAGQDVATDPAPIQAAGQPPEEPDQGAAQTASEPDPVGWEAPLESEIERTPAADTHGATTQADGGPQPGRTSRGLMAALFGRNG